MVNQNLEGKNSSFSLNKIIPYSNYVEVNLPWLKLIPSQWRIYRGKIFLESVDQRSTTGDEELLTVSSKQGVIPRKDATVTMFKAESYAGYKLCWPNDLVINSLWAWANGLGVSKYHGIISSAYGVYRITKKDLISPKFLHLLVRSSPFQWELQVRSKGIWTSRLQLTDESFLNAPFPLPPLEEQKAIVRFLDYTDRRIKRYIHAKQKLIKLLEEEKQAIIHQAVTRGLNPNVPMKPSGVEWLGEISEHWAMINLKFVSKKIQTGSTPITSEKAFYENGTVPWYGPSSCTNVDYINQPIRYLNQIAFDKGNSKLINGPALLIVIIGATLGKMGLMIEGGSTNQQITSFELDTNQVDPLYVLYSLRLSEKWLFSTASSSTIPILDSNVVKNLPIALPPLFEQKKISKYIKNLINQINISISNIKNELSLLQEYRTRLIADIVTGKLDVREAAAHLPEELEEEIDIEESEVEDEEELQEEVDP